MHWTVDWSTHSLTSSSPWSDFPLLPDIFPLLPDIFPLFPLAWFQFPLAWFLDVRLPPLLGFFNMVIFPKFSWTNLFVATSKSFVIIPTRRRFTFDVRTSLAALTAMPATAENDRSFITSFDAVIIQWCSFVCSNNWLALAFRSHLLILWCRSSTQRRRSVFAVQNIFQT